MARSAAAVFVGPEGRLDYAATGVEKPGDLLLHGSGLIGLYDGMYTPKAGDKLSICIANDIAIEANADPAATFAAGGTAEWDAPARRIQASGTFGGAGKIRILSAKAVGEDKVKILLNR
jgi:hypothetical protein